MKLKSTVSGLEPPTSPCPCSFLTAQLEQECLGVVGVKGQETRGVVEVVIKSVGSPWGNREAMFVVSLNGVCP